MFGAKYNRLIFWSISIVLFIVFAIASSFAKYFVSSGQNDNAIIFSVAILVVDFIWINTLANRIRDYGDNPWIALFALIPLANIGLALFYGIAKSNIKEVAQKNDSNSLTNAVYNHSKDIINGIKPAINEYKENHTSSNNNSQSNNINVNESKIYEDIMNEIEQDKKIKATWAKALSQSDGNKDKAESLYISMRFEELKYQQSYQKEESYQDEQCENIETENKVEIIKNSSSKKIVFLIVLISILVTIGVPAFTIMYYNNNSNKNSSTTANETPSKESTYSTKVENNNTIKENLNTNYEKQDYTNNTSFQQIFEYKDWKYESINSFYRIITNGKVGAIGHEFGIIQRQEEYNNYIWLTFSTISDVSPYIGEKVNFKISIDDNVFYQELPILVVNKVSKSLNVVTFSNFELDDYIISLLKKSKKIKIEIVETNKLYNKFDIKYEEFSLEGFVANYLKLKEKFSNSNNKILFEYLRKNDYGIDGIDRIYKLTKNGKSCIYNYIVGNENVVINDSCTGESKYKIKNNNNGNSIENNNYWSPFPYHDAFKLMTGNEMNINQKMVSMVNSKNELIYCLDNMSICKTENELKGNNIQSVIDKVKSQVNDNDNGVYFKADITDLILNLTDSKGNDKMMKLSFSIKSTEPTIATIVEEYKAEITDVVISQISSRSTDELNTVDGKNLLRDELLVEINNIINESINNKSNILRNNVKQILFTTYVIK